MQLQRGVLLLLVVVVTPPRRISSDRAAAAARPNPRHNTTARWAICAARARRGGGGRSNATATPSAMLADTQRVKRATLGERRGALYKYPPLLQCIPPRRRQRAAARSREGAAPHRPVKRFARKLALNTLAPIAGVGAARPHATRRRRGQGSGAARFHAPRRSQEEDDAPDDGDAGDAAQGYFCRLAAARRGATGALLAAR